MAVAVKSYLTYLINIDVKFCVYSKVL